MGALPPYPAPPHQIEAACSNITAHAKPSDEYRAVMGICGVLLLVLDLLGVILFAALKKRYLRLQERPICLPLYVGTGNVLLLIVTFGREVWSRDTFPCSNLVWFYVLPFLFIGGPCVAPIYVYSYKLSRNRNNVRNANRFHRMSKRSGGKRRMAMFREKETFLDQARDFLLIWRRSNEVYDDAKIAVDNKSEPSYKPSLIKVRAAKFLSLRLFIDWVLPTIFCIITGFPFIIVAAIRLATYSEYSSGCVGCDLQLIDYVCDVIGTSIALIAIFAAIYVTWNEPDSMGVKIEVLEICIVAPILVFSSWVLDLVDPGDLEKEAKISWSILYALSGMSILFIMTYLQIFIAAFQRHLALRSKDFELNIEAILEDEKALNALLKHCANELSSENVLFLVDVKTWLSEWESDDTEYVTDRGKAICETFIHPGAEMMINISSSARSEVSKTFAQTLPNSKPSKTLFENAVYECTMIIQLDTFPRFQKTKIFEDEIIKTGAIDSIVIKKNQQRPNSKPPSSSRNSKLSSASNLGQQQEPRESRLLISILQAEDNNTNRPSFDLTT